LSHISDIEENNRLIDLYNQEKQFITSHQEAKQQYTQHHHVIDQMYLSLLHAWVGKYKKKTMEHHEITTSLLHEKQQHYDLINAWYERISMKIKNEYLRRVQQLREEYGSAHQEMGRYIEKYVIDVEEQMIFD